MIYIYTKMRSGPEVINFFMLNSTEHEMLTAHKYQYWPESMECTGLNEQSKSLSCSKMLEFNIFEQDKFHSFELSIIKTFLTYL